MKGRDNKIRRENLQKISVGDSQNLIFPYGGGGILCFRMGVAKI